MTDNNEIINATLLHSIVAVLPGSIVVGGYLRDKLTGRTPVDMDILTPNDPTQEQLTALDNILGLADRDTGYTFVETFNRDDQFVGGSSDYDGADHDERTLRMSKLFEGQNSSGFSYDIIVVPDVDTYVEEFPDNISRVSFSANGLRLYDDFNEGHANKEIRYRLSAELPRLAKLRGYYPDYNVIYVV